MTDNRKLKFIINNIGPLKNINVSFDSDNLNTILFATNGSGKTFISRCFNLLSNIQQHIEPKNLKDLITFDEAEGDFTFDFSDTNAKNVLSFKISKDKILDSTFKSKWILHVFNKEFVDNNVAVNNYAINSSNISGEILLGDETINVAKEEAELQKLQTAKTELEDTIKKEIDGLRLIISDLDIRSSLTEFKEINFDNLLKHESYNGILFERAKENYNSIKNIPEDLKEINNYKYTLDTQLFVEINEAIKKEVSISSISNEFKRKISSKTDFIETGLKLIKEDNLCPFCEKELGDKLDLIDEYTQYFNQEEAKFERILQDLSARLAGFEKDINTCECEYNKIKSLYYEQKKYFADLESVSLPDFIDNSLLSNVITELKNLIRKKKENKSETEFDISFEEQNLIITKYLKDLEDLKILINSQIENINKKKSSILQEQTNSRRQVCISGFGELYNNQEESIKNFKELCKKIADKEKEIIDKQSINKKDKKEIVNEAFEKYLKRFFNNKYMFDKEKQCLLLNEHIITSNAQNVLSDGEKNIIGFCYYLALTHKKINEILDYENLLFVIDDPISSMDYHYVYQVSDIIRHLDKEINIKSNKYRYIILTHNYEFLNLMTKKNISKLNLILSKNNLSKLKKEIILPYTEHLNFINEVAHGVKKVTYQTPNSMRHVLETICNFSSPNKELKTFIQEHDVLANNEYLFTTINDLSHGGIREQKPFTDEDIQEGCKKIIEFINSNYPGQLKILNKEN